MESEYLYKKITEKEFAPLANCRKQRKTEKEKRQNQTKKEGAAL